MAVGDDFRDAFEPDRPPRHYREAEDRWVRFLWRFAIFIVIVVALAALASVVR